MRRKKVRMSVTLGRVSGGISIRRGGIRSGETRDGTGRHESAFCSTWRRTSKT